MSDLSIEQAIAEMRDLVRCRCHPAFTERKLHDPDCNCDSAEAVEVLANALPAVQPDARIKEYEEAYQYALHLAEALRENYPPNPDFRFLGDLVGLLTQIDNMVAGLPQPAVQPDTAPASNLTARGNAATWALYDANLTRMGALQPAHVNETQKSEHEGAVMLTPATKGANDD